MHPDRATTDAERSRRNAIMAKVNVAYEKDDKAAIEKLIIEFGHDPEAIRGEDVSTLLVKTIGRIAQLRRRLNEAQQDIERMKANELYELKLTETETETETETMGGDPLGDLERQLRQQISEKQIELEMLKQ